MILWYSEITHSVDSTPLFARDISMTTGYQNLPFFQILIRLLNQKSHPILYVPVSVTVSHQLIYTTPCSMPTSRKWRGLTGVCEDPCLEMSLIQGISQAAAYSVNNGGATAILDMCNEFGCNIDKGSKVYNALKEMDKHGNAAKLKQQSENHKLAKSKRRRQLFKLYEKRQEDIGYEKKTFEISLPQ